MNDVRSIHSRDRPAWSTCSHLGTCTRCPGLAYMEGNMRGPSSLDCEKSLPGPESPPPTCSPNSAKSKHKAKRKCPGRSWCRSN
jgi:hypothetical protein